MGSGVRAGWACRRVAMGMLAVTLVTISACADADRGGLQPVAEGVVTTTVVAQERRVSSVLTLDGVVVVNPFVRVAAPQDGVLVAMSKGRVGIVSAPGGTAVPVDLPGNAEIVSLLVKPGVRVTAGLPIINARYTGFAIQATVPPEQVYRLYDGVKSVKAQVEVGPGPFDTDVLGVPYPPGAITLPSGEGAMNSTLRGGHPRQSRLVLCDAPTGGGDISFRGGPSQQTSTFPVVTSPPQDATAGVVVIVRVAPDLKLIEGMPARVAIVTAEATGVALPIESVAGISQRGQVYVVKGGRVELRDVTLGITDGSYVLITSGLAVGEEVQIPSPSIVDVD